MPTNNLPQATDVGFAQFTVVQITETFAAVITAQLDQEQKIRNLLKAAEMDPILFANDFINDQEVEDEICRLFPSDDRLHSVMVDAPYHPGSEGKTENPPILHNTGYIMSSDDIKKIGEGFAITDTGYKNIFSAVRLNLAIDQRANIIGMAHRGVPRIVVDSGRINTKLRFQLALQDRQDESQPFFASGSVSAGIKPATLSALERLTTPVAGPRLLVKPVDPRHPEITNLSVNVVGEVEINFKTIFE